MLGYECMATRYVKFAEGEFYHVYNRGTDKCIIYEDPADYHRFQELLYLSNSTEPINVRSIKKQHKNIYNYKRDNNLVAIGAYCLMPNHFHILLKPLVDDGVSTFMSKLSTSYSMYFNKRYERTGGLFEGRYKAKHAAEDNYLKYLFAYIHLNPVKLIDKTWKEEGITDMRQAYRYVSEYTYSSLIDYIEQRRQEGMVLTRSEFPEYFTHPESIKEELFQWLTYGDIEDI